MRAKGHTDMINSATLLKLKKLNRQGYV